MGPSQSVRPSGHLSGSQASPPFLMAGHGTSRVGGTWNVPEGMPSVWWYMGGVGVCVASGMDQWMVDELEWEWEPCRGAGVQGGGGREPALAGQGRGWYEMYLGSSIHSIVVFGEDKRGRGVSMEG